MLEEVIKDEIIDETDTFESNEHNVPVVRRPGRDRPDVSSYLALFEHKIRDQNKLSPPEVQAVSAFLLSAVPEFSIFASVETVLKVCPLHSIHPPAAVSKAVGTSAPRIFPYATGFPLHSMPCSHHSKSSQDSTQVRERAGAGPAAGPGEAGRDHGHRGQRQ